MTAPDAHPMHEPRIQDPTTRPKNLAEHRPEPQCRRLVCQRMTPVARRGADGEKDRHVTLTRLGARLLPHIPPVHRVIGVLAQEGEVEAARRFTGAPMHIARDVVDSTEILRDG
jgi:hypothetical protein